MGPRMREILRVSALNALRVLDIALIMLAFGLGAVTGLSTLNWTTSADFLSSKVSLSSCILLAIAIFLCYAVFSACGLYKSKRMSTKRAEVVDVLRAMTLSTGCLALEGRLFSISVITPRCERHLHAVPATFHPRSNSQAWRQFASHPGAGDEPESD